MGWRFMGTSGQRRSRCLPEPEEAAMVTIDATVVDRVSAEARRSVRPGVALLLALARLLWLVGYLPGLALSMASLGARWVLAAVRLGWRDARRPGGEAP
jgi:hypothetical protein